MVKRDPDAYMFKIGRWSSFEYLSPYDQRVL